MCVCAVAVVCARAPRPLTRRLLQALTSVLEGFVVLRKRGGAGGAPAAPVMRRVGSEFSHAPAGEQ